MPLFLSVCLLSSRVAHLESVRRGNTEQKWKFDYFQSQAGGDKRLVAHHQAEPAVVVSVGSEVQRDQHPSCGLCCMGLSSGEGVEVSEEFSSKLRHESEKVVRKNEALFGLCGDVRRTHWDSRMSSWDIYCGDVRTQTHTAGFSSCQWSETNTVKASHAVVFRSRPLGCG